MLKNTILPKEAYTDHKWFELEMRHIFSKTWAYAGLAEDISEPGQFKCVQAGLNNLLIIMGRDHKLRAFHNICRHRGTQLLTAQGKNQKAITCPYHDWTYDLAGNLLSVPKEQQEYQELDKKCWGLKPAKVDLWRGMLWVHPDVNAEAVHLWFADVEPHLGPHKPEELVESEQDIVIEEIKANWKIVVENYIDHYHLAQLHSGTLNMYDHARAEFGFIGPHFAFWEPLEQHYAQNLEKNSAMPLIDHIPREQMGAWVPMLFPGIGLGESESSWTVFHIQPLTVDKTRVEIRTKVMNVSTSSFLKQTTKSMGFWADRIKAKYADAPKGHPLSSADFMQEDIYVCEQQQKSFASPFYEPGPSAVQGEKPVREHQQVVRQYLDPYLHELG